MSAPDGIVATQLRALLEKLERDREHRSFIELTSAADRARALVRTARGDASRRMREAVRYERARIAECLSLRRAELDAGRRREEHAVLRQLVGRVCEALPSALERHWNDPGGRRNWCEAALVGAARQLCATDWIIEIAAGVERTERDALLARAGALRAGTHELIEHPPLGAGLRVRTPAAMFDASIAGLLDDRAALEARVLREWLRFDSAPGQGQTAPA
jgi:hypothetical protein